MLNIVLFGPPGAGKGTQAQLIKAKYGLEHISTGEVIRREIRTGSPLGRGVEEHISRGELAPDPLVIDIIAEHVEKHRGGPGNIFDGFPRTVAQAEAFDGIMSAHGTPVDVMVSLEVPDQVLVDRIRLRAADSGRADDANVNVIRNRIAVYKAQTSVVADFYARQGKYVAINGLGTVDEVFGRICEALDVLGRPR